MKYLLVCLVVAVGTIWAQSAGDTAEAHRAAAKAAAETDLTGLYSVACPAQPATPRRGAATRGRGRSATPRPDPPREQWYHEPVKVFDNLYFLGTKVHESWGINTPDGIIVLDTLYNYAAKDEIADGLKKVGLDPANIKYVVISHGHGDHDGGAKYLQDTFHTHILLSAPDWAMAERDTRNPRPRQDMVVTDAQKLTLGGETLSLYITPGHTPGTISTLVPVKDHGTPHLAAEWGGTAISAATPVAMLRSYVQSAERFRDIAVGAGADVIITNHTEFDGALTKLAAVTARKPGDPNPYVVGKDVVRRYLTVAEECGKAALITAEQRQ